MLAFAFRAEILNEGVTHVHCSEESHLAKRERYWATTRGRGRLPLAVERIRSLVTSLAQTISRVEAIFYSRSLALPPAASPLLIARSTIATTREKWPQTSNGDLFARKKCTDPNWV